MGAQHSDKLKQAQVARRRPQRGQGVTRAAREHRPEPRLPHEHDQSSDSQRQQRHDERLHRAADDVAQGRVDTGRAPVIEDLVRRHFAPHGRARRRR
jgi:hypothetical protein